MTAGPRRDPTRRTTLTIMTGITVATLTGCFRQVPDKSLAADIRNYGAALDGVTDDTAAVQSAADAALKTGRTLYIPHGNVRLTGAVNIATSVRSDGHILIDSSSTGAVNIVRAKPSVTFTRLEGLSAGSQHIGGLGGSTGDLYLRSSEHLVERNNGAQDQHYIKSELSRVISASGKTSLPLAVTYNNSATVAAVLYPNEPPVTLDRLSILVDGGKGTHPAGFLTIARSDVTCNSLSVLNTSSAGLTNGVVLREAANIEFNYGVIHGFALQGAGYGIARYNTIDVRIIDSRMTGCRHCVSGLANKSTRITRGAYEGGLDDHWCWGFYVDDIQSTVSAGKSHVQAAGADVVVTGGTFTGGRNVLGIRGDTPEMAGSFILEGEWTWTPEASKSALWAMGYTTQNLPEFNYGRPLRSPSKARVSGGQLNLPPGQLCSIINIFGARFTHEYWEDIEISRVQMSDTALVIAIWTDRNSAVYTVRVGAPIIRISDMEFQSPSDSILIHNTGTTPGLAIYIEVIRCCNLYLKLPNSGLGRIQIDNPVVRHWLSATIASNPGIGPIRFSN